MSLRVRLTLLYASLLGSVLLIFGLLVYGLVSLILLSQVDERLEESANQIIDQLSINAANQIDIRPLVAYQTSENLLIQLWGNDRELRLARPASLNEELDRFSLAQGENNYSTVVSSAAVRVRVLTVPLETERGPAGVLQVGQNLSIYDNTRRVMGTVLLLLTVAAMTGSAVAAWVIISRALEPIATVQKIATQITRASDLQRRIPTTGLADDEIGELIQVFNQTLERMESLFNAQQRFLADVSHDLRTPLTVIKGNAGLLRKLRKPDLELLREIENEVDRLTRMVEELLLLAQAESGSLPMEIKPVELDALLLDVIKGMQKLAGDNRRVRITDIDEVQVMGDADRLKQVLVNIIGNAIQHTPTGSQVSIALRKAKGLAQVVVSDNGPGIPADDLPHIFERFYRGEKSRKRMGTSFGLGLSIAYFIMKGHGGNIDVQSIEGHGTTFTVWLPMLDKS